MLGGYIGRLLFVDLSRKNFSEEDLDESLCRKYMGGYGIGVKILYNQQAGGVNSLGPENMLGFITGPLTGTPALFGARCTVVAKSPKTYGWGDSNIGGNFGPSLKFAGYDGVFFTGLSKEPIYLFIDNGKVALREASHLWGKDTFETDDLLKKELGKDVSIVCIGPAGEKLSLIAAVMSKRGTRAAGRTGLGAVMGSKRLKAVVVRGRKEVPIADREKLESLRKEQLKLITSAGPFDACASV